MENLDLFDVMGYIGTAVVLFSFLNKNMTRMRIINGIGCAIFIIAYGLIKTDPDLPVVITNASILLIHLYYLFIERRPKSV
jgi:hypothetical protein